MNMIKVLWWRFQQCLGTITIFLVEGSSETRLFRQLSIHVFRVRNFGNKKAVTAIFSFKIFQISYKFQKGSKKLRKSFFVSELIPSGLVSLNCPYVEQDTFHQQPMLTSSRKFWHVNKRDFFEHNFFPSNQWIW